MPSIATQTTTFLAECPRVLENKKVLKPAFFKRMKQIHERALVKGKKDAVKESKINKEIMNFMKNMTSLAIADMRVKAKSEKKALKEAKKAKKELDEKDAKIEREVQKVEAKVQKKAEKKHENKAEKKHEKKVAKKAEKEAEKEAKKAEKEAKKAEKEAKKAGQKLEKEAEKEAKKAGQKLEKAASAEKDIILKRMMKRDYKINKKDLDKLSDPMYSSYKFVSRYALENSFDM